MGILETIDKIDKVIVIAKPIIEGVSSKLQPEMKQFAEVYSTQKTCTTSQRVGLLTNNKNKRFAHIHSCS